MLSHLGNKILSKIIFFLTALLPKKKWFVIQTFPTWEDSGVVIYKELLKTNIKKIIWLVPELPTNPPIEIDKSKTKFIKRKSIKGICYFILSKYVFITHGLYFRNFPKNQVSVNMWHGMPLKKIGLLNNGIGLKTTYTLSTSTFFNETLSKSFGVSKESILPIGLPRNENLFCKENQIKKQLKLEKDTRIVFWLPTYRKSSIGEIREDGTVFNNPFNLPDFDQPSFNYFLKEHNIVCFFKVHPMADMGNYNSSSNLLLIDDEYLYQRKLSLYKTLAAADFLISDISSIVVDYLLLDKPIIFSFADKEAYINSRGLNSTEIIDNPPGKICFSQNDILDQIQLLVEGIDEYKENRKKLKQLYHGQTDYKDCSKKLFKKLNLY